MPSNAKKPRPWGNKAAGQRDAIADEAAEVNRLLRTLERQLLDGQFTRNGLMIQVLMARKANMKELAILKDAGAPVDLEAL